MENEIVEEVLPNDFSNVERAVDAVVEQTREVGTTVDYSDALDKISQLLAYQNMQIVLLTVVLVLFVGIFGGYLVTRWMRN